ncbi:plastocyanin/azurin family copper-binding protein [Microvirga yunnanensis]|uniref:plastocyanin/azurin family copper-binding protein n=1 Tax=Microvirga yunnanensis TaxID=2953740 RepID=UPI0021CAD33B|nr:plastocyanin/azurin family copper-binding protein [Microvirga sp. HBU65207]
MTISRRTILRIGGGVLAGLALPRLLLAADAVEIRMKGNADGSHVWFDPMGLRIEPGQTVRWINLDPGNSHTATAYHPKIFERPLRIPEGAEPWNSDYLLPNESFSVTLTQEGVYDFYCVPHEHAGMVGRIVVGQPGRPPAASVSAQAAGGEPIPDIALQAFPPVDEIMRRGIVRRT